MIPRRPVQGRDPAREASDDDAPRLSIAQVVTRMDVGGVPDHVTTLATGLAARHAVTVFAAAFHPTHAARLAAAGVAMRVIPFARLPDPWADLGALRRLRASLRAGDFDIVHTHMSKAALLGVLATRAWRGAPRVVNTAHNLGGLALPGRVMRGVFRRYDRILLGHGCDRVIMVSGTLRAAAIGAGILTPDHVVAVPNGIAPDRFAVDAATRAALRADLGIPRADPVILCTARLVWWKGLDTLIDAVARLKCDPAPHLLIAGDGPLAAALQARAACAGLAGRVRFLGARDDIPALLAACDIFALSSVSEGMPISILEAMAAGRPTAATAVGGVVEVVDHGATGLLVPSGDAAALAAAFARLIAAPGLRVTMGQAARAHVARAHSAAEMVARTAAVYAQTIAPHERAQSERGRARS